MVVMQRQLDRSVGDSLRRLLSWIAVCMGLLCALILGLGWQQQASLNTVYEDRVLPLHALQRIGHTLNVTVQTELESPVPDVGALRQQLERVRSIWTTYLATYLTAEEKLLAQQAGTRLNAVLAAAEAGSREVYGRALHSLNIELGALLELQVRVAEDERQRASELGRWAQALALGCLVGSVLLLLKVWQLLQREVVWPVRVVADALAQLSEGDGELGPEAQALDGDYAEVGQQLRQLQGALGERLISRPPA